MAGPSQQLPPGWQTEWDVDNQRYFFVESSTGRTQWEHPGGTSPLQDAGSASPPPAHHGKRRVYAAEQTKAYTGTSEEAPVPWNGGLATTGTVGEQIFTPGLAAEGGFAQQQQAGAPAHYGQTATKPDYINSSSYGQVPYDQASGSAGLADKFGRLNVSSTGGYQLQATNLLASPPDPRELAIPPPAIRLPPGAGLASWPHSNAHYSYARSTVNAIPSSESLAKKAKIPLALIITPHRSLDDGDEPIPLQSDAVIARCRRCLGYINPYVQFIDGGNRQLALFDWDSTKNQPADRWVRPELNHAVIEYVAPNEYMVRPPQPPVYVFLIDVSHSAVQSGVVATAARTILENLDRIPNQDDRTKVSIVAFDTSLYFFSMPAGTEETSMLVVSDVDDVYLPQPNDLRVTLSEARASIESLLDRLHDLFKDNHTTGSCLGAALQAGYKLINPIGGKIIALTSNLPSIGAGVLKHREDSKILGTSKESSLLQAADPFYKTFAIECSKALISVDLFLCGASYQDVASLAYLPHYTSGQTYYYPAFSAARAEDAAKLAHELGAIIAMPIMLETIMRVRMTRGLRANAFHGNFFVRSTDLLSMPTVPTDTSYAVEFGVEENLTAPFVVLQTAVLHTTCFGERRIRVITLALPTTSNLSDVYASADQAAIVTFLANKAVERSVLYSLDDARDTVLNKLIDILQAYKSSMTSAGASSQLALCENMSMLPLLVLALLKNVALRKGEQIPSDLRAYAHSLLTSLPTQSLIPYIHAVLYSLHTMPAEAGTIGEHGVIMPPPLPPTSEGMESHGLYLIEDGQAIFLYVRRDAVPQLLLDVFGISSYDALRGGKTTLPLLDNPFSQRVNAIVQKTREMRRGVYFPHLYVVKDDSNEVALRVWALSHLILDRTSALPGYQQFLGQLKDKINGSSY
ncbi:CPII coat sec24 protein [Auriscalpium vulgare]|uniref:CPII coat sec24 protein n=1 Tax=Auriscalpium vulgare TaxID=40419 RepID=A0ACB8S7I1_9AGAM|nr:CPII coat sec24 protein [Auriscalpium vulgare]